MTDSMYKMLDEGTATKQDFENCENTFEIAVNGTKLDSITLQGFGSYNTCFEIPGTELVDGYNLIEIKVVSVYNNLDVNVSPMYYQFKNNTAGNIVNVYAPSTTHLGTSYKTTTCIYNSLPTDTEGCEISGLCECVLYTYEDKNGVIDRTYCSTPISKYVNCLNRAWPEYDIAMSSDKKE